MSVHNTLETLFRQVLEQDDLRLRDDMVAGETDGWDSLAHVNLMVAIEEAFGINLDINDYSELQDVRSIKRTLIRRMDGQVADSLRKG